MNKCFFNNKSFIDSVYSSTTLEENRMILDNSGHNSDERKSFFSSFLVLLRITLQTEREREREREREV